MSKERAISIKDFEEFSEIIVSGSRTEREMLQLMGFLLIALKEDLHEIHALIKTLTDEPPQQENN